jgi:hypothetical protein
MDRAEDEFIIPDGNNALGGEEIAASIDLSFSSNNNTDDHTAQDNNHLRAEMRDGCNASSNIHYERISVVNLGDFKQAPHDPSSFACISCASASTCDTLSSPTSPTITSTVSDYSASDPEDNTIHLRRTSCTVKLPECTDGGLIKLKRTDHDSFFKVTTAAEPSTKRSSKVFGIHVSLPLKAGGRKSATATQGHPNGWLQEQERRNSSALQAHRYSHIGTHNVDALSRPKTLSQYVQRNYHQGRDSPTSSLHSGGSPSLARGSPSPLQHPSNAKKHGKKILIKTCDGQTKLIETRTGAGSDFRRLAPERNRFEVEKEKQIECELLELRERHQRSPLSVGCTVC